MRKCACGRCSEMIPDINTKGQPATFKKGHHLGTQKGELNGPWKGGRRKEREYIQLWIPNHHYANIIGYVYEHRIVWEGTHKASLLHWADVHHIDGNRQNNDPNNLEAMMHGQHSRHTITTVGMWK